MRVHHLTATVHPTSFRPETKVPPKHKFKSKSSRHLASGPKHACVVLTVCPTVYTHGNPPLTTHNPTRPWSSFREAREFTTIRNAAAAGAGFTDTKEGTEYLVLGIVLDAVAITSRAFESEHFIKACQQLGLPDSTTLLDIFGGEGAKMHLVVSMPFSEFKTNAAAGALQTDLTLLQIKEENEDRIRDAWAANPDSWVHKKVNKITILDPSGGKSGKKAVAASLKVPNIAGSEGRPWVMMVSGYRGAGKMDKLCTDALPVIVDNEEMLCNDMEIDIGDKQMRMDEIAGFTNELKPTQDPSQVAVSKIDLLLGEASCNGSKITMRS